MIQTSHPLEPPPAGKLQLATRILRRDEGVDGPDRRAIMTYLHPRY